eukprot:1944525-Rhodomonas_salina.1
MSRHCLAPACHWMRTEGCGTGHRQSVVRRMAHGAACEGHAYSIRKLPSAVLNDFQSACRVT